MHKRGGKGLHAFTKGRQSTALAAQGRGIDTAQSRLSVKLEVVRTAHTQRAKSIEIVKTCGGYGEAKALPATLCWVLSWLNGYYNLTGF